MRALSKEGGKVRYLQTIPTISTAAPQKDDDHDDDHADDEDDEDDDTDRNSIRSRKCKYMKHLPSSMKI